MTASATQRFGTTNATDGRRSEGVATVVLTRTPSPSTCRCVKLALDLSCTRHPHVPPAIAAIGI